MERYRSSGLEADLGTRTSQGLHNFELHMNGKLLYDFELSCDPNCTFNSLATI